MGRPTRRVADHRELRDPRRRRRPRTPRPPAPGGRWPGPDGWPPVDVGVDGGGGALLVARRRRQPAALPRERDRLDPTTDEWRHTGNCVLATPDTCPSALLRAVDGQTARPPTAPPPGLDRHGDHRRAGNRAYDPATDTWRTLPTRPIEGAVQASVWTGEELLVLVANRSDSSRTRPERRWRSRTPPPTTPGRRCRRPGWARSRSPGVGRRAGRRPRLRDAGRHLRPRRRSVDPAPGAAAAVLRVLAAPGSGGRHRLRPALLRRGAAHRGPGMGHRHPG